MNSSAPRASPRSPNTARSSPGLLDAVASDAVPAESLANVGAERISRDRRDTCIVSLLAGPLPRAGRDLRPAPGGASRLLAPLLHQRSPAGQRHELSAYVERFGLGAEFMAPMRARGRVLGQVVVLRRGDGPAVHAGRAAPDPGGRGRDRPRPRRAARALPTAPRRPGRARGRQAQPPRARDPRPARARHTNREIAERVHLSVRTVEWHRARIQSKLHVTGRAALAQIARRYGLVGGTALDRVE